MTHLRHGLGPLVALYPECPFCGLWAGTPRVREDDDLSKIRRSVENVLDRRSKPATFMQANAIQLSLMTGTLNVFAGSMFSRLDALLTYPGTDESRMVAAAVRASINGLAGWSDQEGLRTWKQYFWRRGMELTPCELS